MKHETVSSPQARCRFTALAGNHVEEFGKDVSRHNCIECDAPTSGVTAKGAAAACMIVVAIGLSIAMMTLAMILGR